MSKSLIIGGVKMKSPLMTGGGVHKTPASLENSQRADTFVGADETGSYTPQRREGNEGKLAWPPTWQEFVETGFGLNAYGMPNCGYEEAYRTLPVAPITPVIVNIAGFSPDDYIEGIRLFSNHPGVAGLTGNKGCPNAHDQKTVPMTFDIDSQEQTYEGQKKLGLTIPYWEKLSPCITKEELDELRDTWPQLDFSEVPTVEPGYRLELLRMIAKYKFIRAVIQGNTLPNVIYRLPDGTTATSPNGGKAGLSGSPMKLISLKLVREARSVLPMDIDVIGCGGGITGDDAVDSFKNGAAGFQYTSAPFWYGDPQRFFTNIVQDSTALQEHLANHMEEED